MTRASPHGKRRFVPTHGDHLINHNGMIVMLCVMWMNTDINQSKLTNEHAIVLGLVEQAKVCGFLRLCLGLHCNRLHNRSITVHSRHETNRQTFFFDDVERGVDEKMQLERVRRRLGCDVQRLVLCTRI